MTEINLNKIEQTIPRKEILADYRTVYLSRQVSIISRREVLSGKAKLGIFGDGKELPQFIIRVNGAEEVYYQVGEYEKRLEALAQVTDANEDLPADDQPAQPVVENEELHEVERINRIGEMLNQQFGCSLMDFLLKSERTVSGEAMPTKFQLINGTDSYEIASLGEICSGIRQIGGKGIEIKRFKGLGEMNADQLWETTMNPATRTLLSVRLDDAGEADRLFSILMGDNVEKRRTFIQDHALEVQNLDV